MDDAFERLCRADITRQCGNEGEASSDLVAELRAAFEQSADQMLAETAALADAVGRSMALYVGLGRLVMIFWRTLAAETSFKCNPAALDSSVALEAIGSLLARVCSLDDGMQRTFIQGSAIIAWACEGLDLKDDESEPRFIPFLDWFGSEILIKRWGVEDPWCSPNPFNDVVPLVVAARHATSKLLSFLVHERGCAVDGVVTQEAASCPLFQAFARGNVAAFNWLLEHGASPFTTYKEGKPVGLVIFRKLQSHSDKVPLTDILLERRSAMLVRLIEAHGILDGCKDRYDKKGFTLISDGLTEIAMSAYPRNPASKEHPILHNPEASRILDLVFSKDWSVVLETGHVQALLLWICPEFPIPCPLSDDDCFDLLSRYRRAGAEFSLSDPHDPEPSLLQDITLAHLAAMHGQLGVIDFAIESCGCPVDGFYCNHEGRYITPLALAIVGPRPSAALTLLRKHRAQACYPNQQVSEQPIMRLLSKEGRSDQEAEVLVRALIERDPSLLDIKCFKGPRVEHSPITLCIRNKPHCLKLLLTSGLPNANELSTHFWVNSAGDDWHRVPAALPAAHLKSWDCLEVLVTHGGARVMETMDDAPSVAEVVIRATHEPDPPSRALIALVLAKAKKEKEEDQRRQAALRAGVATGATTNSFEDPSATATSADDTERKATSKKQKKSKRKKKAAGKANAGAGGAAPAAGDTGDSSSGSDDEDEPFEEPDDNLVDSRFAPSLDVLFAAMGFPPGGPTAVPAGPTTSTAPGDDGSAAGDGCNNDKA